MLSSSSCVLPAVLHDHRLDATSLPFFTGKGIIPFPPSGTWCSSTERHSRHFGSCPHVASPLPMDFVNQNGLFCFTEAHRPPHAMCLDTLSCSFVYFLSLSATFLRLDVHHCLPFHLLLITFRSAMSHVL